jgi:anti-sigma factor ChrR (cupin superfamily)
MTAPDPHDSAVPPARDALGEPLPSPHAAAASGGTGVATWLAEVLPPVAEPPGVRQRLAERLAARVAQSAQANRAMRTVRTQRPAGAESPWQTVAHGVRVRALQQAADASASMLMELAPGAVFNMADLPAPANRLHEWLVLAGELALNDLHLRPQGYVLQGTGEPPARLVALGTAPVRLYVHALAADLGAFGSVAGCHPVAADAPGWQPLRPGVDIKPLHMGPQGVSLLARFAAGACVPAHPHGVDEECLMLEGDLFLGDVLLREGDFQFAPRGSAHGDLFADSPCVLFFHGAIDPSSVDVAYRAAAGWPS